MKFFKRKKALLANIFVIIVLITTIIGIKLVNAAQNIPNLIISYEGTNIENQSTNATTINGKLNEEIEVKYKVTPQDIPVSNVSTQNNVDVTLVIDTSGSMGRYRLSDNHNLENDGNYNGTGSRFKVMQASATKFINSLSGKTNIKVGIVTFDNYGSEKKALTTANTSGVTALNTTVNNLGVDTNNGTNTGDGIRVALRQLQADTTANTKKYIILMTDGEPSYYMYNSQKTQGIVPWNNQYTGNQNAYGYYTQTSDNGSQTRGGVGADGYDDNYDKPSGSTYGRSYNYADTMCKQIKSLGYSSFEIGYSSGASSIKTQNLAADASGQYYSALDATSMDNVLNSISNQLKSSFPIQNVSLNFTVPDGLVYTGSMANVTINGNQYTQNLPNIVYTLSSDQTKYTADYFYITFKMSASKAGTFSLPQSAILTYNGLDGNLVTINNAIQPITYNVTDAIPNITAKINNNPNPVSLAQNNINLSYKISAAPFSFYSNPVYSADPKDVIFVVDTSSGMNGTQLNTLQNGLFGAIVNNSLIQNARYGIVTFNSAVKDDYILGGLTNNITTLDSAIKSIATSSDSGRDAGNAMEHAKTIFTNYGRSDSAKYLVFIATNNVTYTAQQLTDIENSNYKIITVNLGYITPPSKVNDVVIPGAVEPNNNIKALHYNLIGKQDNGDNVLQKADNNYFLNIDYGHVTNTSNPNEFFTIFENSQNMNNQNEDVNSVLPQVAIKIENSTVQAQQQTYVFSTKLKFMTNGKFGVVNGLNVSTGTQYDVETPAFDVQYKWNASDGQYELDPSKLIPDQSFNISIKSNIDTSNLQFGPGIVSYVGFYNNPISTNIDAVTLNLKSNVLIQNFGVYNGMVNNQPSISESSQPISIEKGSNLSLGATLTGTLNSNTNIKLDIPNGIVLNGDINVYSYDASGNLTKIGTMIKSTSDASKITYTYSSIQSVVNSKILILYNESLGDNATQNTIYSNSLYTPDQNKNVQIQMANQILQIKDFGLYKGILNNAPNILVSDQPFDILKGSNIRIGATLTGSLNNTTNMTLDIQNALVVSGDINVYSYDDNGNLTPIGTLVQATTDSGKITYKYSGQDVVNSKILIVYNENLTSDSSQDNTLSTPDGNHRTVEIQTTNNMPELF